MIKMKKVYCEDCKYYCKRTLVALLNDLIDICSYPDNQIPIYEEENYLHPKRIKGYKNIKGPYEINMNNDCKWYREKECLDKGEFL